MVIPPSKFSGIYVILENGYVALTKQINPRTYENGRVRKKVKGGIPVNKKEIREDLIEQLKAQGKYQKFYIDMVNDYVKYFGIKNSLQKDIRDRGLRYKVTTGNGFTSEKPNESVQNLMKVTSTMLKILQDLGLQTPVQTNDNDEDYM